MPRPLSPNGVHGRLTAMDEVPDEVAAALRTSRFVTEPAAVVLRQ
ncbi:hypothetical protein [Streptomyces sp. XY431]|nr:hypothetical protein [Streptomyces sp. XY431]